MWLPKQDGVPALMPWNVSKHLDGQHDQQQHGRWAGGGAAVDEFDTADVIAGRSAASIFDRMLAEDGISLNFRGESPKEGYMVSRDSAEGFERKVPEGELTPAVIADYLREHRSQFDAPVSDTPMGRVDRERTFFGAWLDTSAPAGERSWYLDVSDRIPTLGVAARAGEDRKQLAIWDAENARALTHKDPEYRVALRDENMRQERSQARRGGTASIIATSERQAEELREEWGVNV